MPHPNPTDPSAPVFNLDEEAELEAVKVDLVGGRAKALPRRGTGNAYPWIWFYDPRRWGVLDGKLVPLLVPVPLVRGVQNVTQTRSGKIDVSALIVDQRRRGRMVIPTEWGPNGSYCRKIAGMPEYVDAWTHPIRGSSKPRVDKAGKANWLLGLVAEGKIPPCPTSTLEALQEKLARSIGRMQDRYARLPSASASIERWRAVQKVVDAEVAKRRKAGGATAETTAAPDSAVQGMDGKGDAAARVREAESKKKKQ